MKKKLLLFVLLLIPLQTKSGALDDYFNKLWLFFLIEMSTTFVHECGHSIIIAMNEGISAIYMGINDDAYRSGTKKVNFVTMNPKIGCTHISKFGSNKSRAMQCQVVAAGPTYGIGWNILLYNIIGILQHRFSPALFDSLRMFTLVQAFSQFCYGAIPFCPTGDTQMLYTRSKLMSASQYDSVAAKNLKKLQDLSDFCIFFALIKKAIRTIGTKNMVYSMDLFKKNNPDICFIYKIVSLYAMKYGIIGGVLGKIIDSEKKRLKLPDPSPLDWMGGLAISPLII